MTIATRLDTDMAHWVPVTRHYQVDGGYLAVSVNQFLTAEGTDVYFCDERAVAPTMEPIMSYPDGTTHEEALQMLGYTVVDNVGPEQPRELPVEEPTPQEQSVISMLPPQIAEMVVAAIQNNPTPTGETAP